MDEFGRALPGRSVRSRSRSRDSESSRGRCDRRRTGTPESRRRRRRSGSGAGDQDSRNHSMSPRRSRSRSHSRSPRPSRSRSWSRRRSWSRSRSRSTSRGRSRSRSRSHSRSFSRSRSPAHEDVSDRPAGYGPVGANLVVEGLPPIWVADKVHWAAAKKELRPLFEKYGPVLSIRSAAINPTRFVGAAARRRAKAAIRAPQNRCFLSFSSAEQAAAAIATLDGADLQGRTLGVSLAEDQGVRDGHLRPLAAMPGRQEGEGDVSALPSSFCSRDSKSEVVREQECEAVHASNAAGICSMCGKRGHFVQGCPLTLGSRTTLSPSAAATSSSTVHEDTKLGDKARIQAQALAVLRRELFLVVEVDQIQLIIGQNGERLARIRETSGASVRCLDPLDSNDASKCRERGLSGNERLILIEGLSAQVNTAQRLVLEACSNSATNV